MQNITPVPERCPSCGHSVRPQSDHDVVFCWCGALMWDGAQPAPVWRTDEHGKARSRVITGNTHEL